MECAGVHLGPWESETWPPIPRPVNVHQFSCLRRLRRPVEGLLDIIVNWLGSAENMMGLYRVVFLLCSPPFSSTRAYTYVNPLDSMMLINSLLPRTTYIYWVKFTEIEQLNVPNAVVRLMYLKASLLRSSLPGEYGPRRVPPQESRFDREDLEVLEVLNTTSKWTRTPLSRCTAVPGSIRSRACG